MYTFIVVNSNIQKPTHPSSYKNLSDFVYMHQNKNMLKKLQIKRLELTQNKIKPIKLFIVVKPVQEKKYIIK